MREKMSNTLINDVKRTQEQATAAWVQYLYDQRISIVQEAFNKQNFNLSEALKELNSLKLFVADKNHILGNYLTKHGEIAEHCQVNISNARNLVKGLKAEYTFEGVGRLAQEDYLKNGEPIQSKFYNGSRGTIRAIIKHLNTYPDFVKNGGSYEIPYDQFNEMKRVMGLFNSNQRSLLSKRDMRLVNDLLKLRDATGIDFTQDIHTSVVTYSDVQVTNVDATIDKEEQSIRSTDQDRREETYYINRPTTKEAVNVSIKSALIEGGVSFVIAYVKKRKEGKSISQFTIEDWKDLGIQFGKGSVKGGIRGGSIYALTHFTATPACIASAYVTAIFGIYGMIGRLRTRSIDVENFVIACESLSLDIAISALSSMAGQMFIPIPVLGAIIGNILGEVIYDICKYRCSKQELKIIERSRKQLRLQKEQLDKEFVYYSKALDAEFDKFKTIEELAFDEDVNLACSKSIHLAEIVGVPDEQILRGEEDLKRFLEE